jgi:hypothetical protein
MVVDVVAGELDRVHERIAGRFGRAEPRARVREYVSGLVAGLERKNGWTLAEHAGEACPDGMQRLLRRADWDVDGVRDDVRGYVIEHLGDPDGVLIVDDTGFLKKGTRSAGVQRQYSGTAGLTENSQIGGAAGLRFGARTALIDRELYLPQSWAEDPERCRPAGIPERVEFATKPRQAQAMIAPAGAAGVPFAWFTADETYGQGKWLADHRDHPRPARGGAVVGSCLNQLVERVRPDQVRSGCVYPRSPASEAPWESGRAESAARRALDRSYCMHALLSTRAIPGSCPTYEKQGPDPAQAAS